MKHGIAFLIPLCLAALAWALDVAKTAGAHPWWSDTVILIGTGLGFVLGLFLVFLKNFRYLSALLTAATGLALGIATWGKARFAASYAEDALAGQMWYFGWIAVFALAIAALFTALWPRPSGR